MKLARVPYPVENDKRVNSGVFMFWGTEILLENTAIASGEQEVWTCRIYAN